MQNQAILAGIRALVQQIDQLERQNAMKASHGVLRAPANTIRYAAGNDRVSMTATPSKSASIARRLGVSSRNFHQVAHATGRDVRYAN